ncbi:hypothetical protein BDR22DRAFT_885456 [Usnea florida]
MAATIRAGTPTAAPAVANKVTQATQDTQAINADEARFPDKADGRNTSRSKANTTKWVQKPISTGRVHKDEGYTANLDPTPKDTELTYTSTTKPPIICDRSFTKVDQLPSLAIFDRGGPSQPPILSIQTELAPQESYGGKVWCCRYQIGAGGARGIVPRGLIDSHASTSVATGSRLPNPVRGIHHVRFRTRKTLLLASFVFLAGVALVTLLATAGSIRGAPERVFMVMATTREDYEVDDCSVAQKKDAPID